MKNQTSNSTINSQNGSPLKEQLTNVTLQTSQLMQLFEDQLKDIYWAEKAMIKAIPRMIQSATSMELIVELSAHLEETYMHAGRLAKVFATIRVKPTVKKCKAMEGLIIEAEEISELCQEGAMRDAGIISAAQKIEHYEIATYGTLRQFAETLDLTEAVRLLEATLEEEKRIDKKLSELATYTINEEAAYQ